MAEAGHVTRIQHEGRDIHIVGTAHISQKSVLEVQRVIEAVRPDVVCVELDQTRYEALIDETRWRKLDVFQIIREKKVLFLMTSLALTAYQRKLGEKLGVKPGAELLAAVRAAEAVGARVVLADRDIQATLKRTWRSLSFWNKLQLSSGLVAAPFEMDELTEEKVEELKDRDTISEVLHELARLMPDIKRPLIDERDLYLMSIVREAPGERIVAVVGAGHVEGMLAHLHEPVDREKLCEIPPPSWWVRAVQWLIPAIVLGAFYYGYVKHPGEDFRQMVLAWVLPTALLTALLSIVAGAKPLTVLAGALAAPFTTLNPTIGAGMVTGLVEAWLRRPTVQDCEHVADDILSIRSIYRNRFTRVLLVATLSTIGAASGAWIGATWVVSLL